MLLRELQRSKIDGAEFIQLRRQIEELRPLIEKTENLNRDLGVHKKQRRKLLAEWEDIKAEEFRGIEAAAKRVSQHLRDRVKVRVAIGWQSRTARTAPAREDWRQSCRSA